MAINRLTLSKEDNDDLVELFDNREPGERIKLSGDFEILENTDRDVVLAVREISHNGDSAKLDQAEDDGEPMDEKTSETLGAVVSGVMGKGMK